MTALDEVAAAVGAGRTVAEVRDVLRAGGRVSMTSADVLRVLTRYPHRFRPDGTDPPRWWPADELPAGEQPPAMSGAPAFDLYAWQVDALEAWRRRSRRGVVEAVTGTGKTMVGVAAAGEELARGGQVLVLVPTRELLEQWVRVLAEHGPRRAHVGRLGGGHGDDLGRHDIVVAVVNSARDADLRPRRPGGLLVADECHRYGSDGNRVALHAGFGHRLGLSATYARADEGHLTWLDPYFGGTCFRMGYARAIADGVVAHFTVDLLGVELAPPERDEYERLTAAMSVALARLVAGGLLKDQPAGAFFATISRLARSDDGPLAAAARGYLAALQERRRVLAGTPSKADALDALAPAVRDCERAIVFTLSIAAAEQAAARLCGHEVQAAAIHSQLDATTRRGVLARFAAGELRALAAPQVLDEGVDVPAADLAIILAASRSRRQMIQRMGRVLRRKPDGRVARFVIVYASETVEDPACGAHEGFLDEVTPVADFVRQLRASARGRQSL
ncbi:MAG: DEAD/DEAH box helicase [Acidimicrobiia bacterium]|nr:DEAD/DEAH box helicase [Acidimicrobiia bacterium]